MKEPREGDMFSRLERDMVHDLSVWRREVLSLFERASQAAMENEQRMPEVLSPLDTFVSQQASMKRLTSSMDEVWDTLDEAPQPGEYMQITGPVWWCDSNSDPTGTSAHLLMDNRKIYGNYVDWKILPYFDENMPQASQYHKSVRDEHTHPYGIHLVIEEPTFTDAGNNFIPIYCDEIYVPIHYDRARFVVYGNYDSTK